MVDVFVKEKMKSGLSIDTVTKFLSSFDLEKRHHTPFYENIEREGIPREPT
jgi:hypothetical protein